ncbi:MAG: DUF499 domain-containing protein [Gemmatimonadaceae bacterium]
MALTNKDRVTRGLDLLRDGLAVRRARTQVEVRRSLARRATRRPRRTQRRQQRRPAAGPAGAALHHRQAVGPVFGNILSRGDRTLVLELTDVRNKWAHSESFSSDDVDRALDSVERLLNSVGASQADEARKLKLELRRTVYDEQVRGAQRKAGGTLIESASAASLSAWRDVVTPHADVASGRYQQAEFAADLWQVHLGEGSDEYRKPSEFFRRTFLTASLKQLLIGGIQRLSGTGGDPVVQLQTNFGGGKTHSMLALYHLFSGARITDLPGVDTLLAESGVKSLVKAKRVVLVGNKISAGSPSRKPDGTVVHTLWGELAYQLGGKKAYAKVKEDDERATSPGDKLRELFVEYGPSLILIDEWVAYARQLHDQSDLPAGGFETQFTFAQALTESAKLAGNCLLVISLPASDTTGSPHTQSDDVEVGGIRGREALDRLRNVVGRLESSWRPATAEEGFEIVRRRLFEPIAGDAGFKQRDVTARAFAELYRSQTGEFPSECRSIDYEKRIQAAFPIHPEVFDRLYTDWSTLVKFQRTRGVLRLMAAVIHALWDKGDRNPLILPSTIPIDDPRVQFELTRYLSDNWVPIIEKDVDGPNSLPKKLDENPALGRLHATRRVARTIYLGSAPQTGAAHRGIDDQRIKLGCVMPGEPPAVFGDALRQLASAATYLYQDDARAWYDTQPTVTKLAADRAEQLKRSPDKVSHELEERLRFDLRKYGDFSRIHPVPRSGADVPDDLDARLVVIPAEYPYSGDADNDAFKAAKAILESRGSAPRLYRNTLVFLAADKARLRDLEDAIRKFLAWESILAEKETLDLSPFQQKQAETQRRLAESTLVARVPETYQWLIIPEQPKPTDAVRLRAAKLTGSDPLAVRASRKLKTEEAMVGVLGATVLRKYMDDVPLWPDNHVEVRKLVEDFAKYPYLPRLAGPEVLVRAARDGVALLTWEHDSFAFAESYDDAVKRYRGLRRGELVNAVTADGAGVLVKPSVARAQLDRDVPGTQPTPPGTVVIPPAPGNVEKPGSTPPSPGTSPVPPTRYFGTVALDAARVGRDAGRIAEEVISHLAGLVGSDVSVTLEISASVPGGVPEQVVRVVTENSRTLKFSSHGFERE